MESQEVKPHADDVAWLRAIADEAGVPVESVIAMYREEYARLHEGARVLDFLPVLATSNLKRRMLREHHPPDHHAIVTPS